MGILKLADIHDLSIYLFTYDFVHHLVPRPLVQKSLRHSDDPRISIVRTELVRRSKNYRGPNLWMHLDDKLKKISSKNSFKCQMKKRTIMEY